MGQNGDDKRQQTQQAQDSSEQQQQVTEDTSSSTSGDGSQNSLSSMSGDGSQNSLSSASGDMNIEEADAATLKQELYEARQEVKRLRKAAAEQHHEAKRLQHKLEEGTDEERLQAAEVAMKKSAAESMRLHAKLAKSMAALDKAKSEAAAANKTSNEIRKEVVKLQKELESETLKFRTQASKTEADDRDLRRRVTTLTSLAKKWHSRAMKLHHRVHSVLLEDTVTEAGKPWDEVDQELNGVASNASNHS